MTGQQKKATTEVFRPRTGAVFTVIALVLAVIGMISAVISYGPAGIPGSWPLLAVAFLAWWLFRYPRVVISDAEILIYNPLQTIRVPWAALIDVDTRYAMKLVTPGGSFTAWAAPAPGVWGTHRGRVEHVRNLPASSYGPAQSVRPGDLKNTDSGTAAFLVRSRWETMINADRIDVEATETSIATRRINWPYIVAFVLLLAAGFAATAVLF